ncbi:MAG: alanyl-tRNA synthetase [Candidatus Paceibacter sp.]|jgi:alanyl-tRNA synthetase|nr:alanyl-tRNA synthetase [Candidatus Paceibacter sp.]
MTLDEIRNKYLAFYKAQGHVIVPSASLIPENDPTTLFTGSGMQPMVPYLLGQTHPAGTRIADSQKSFRTGDIDDVGDNRHTTFFEMLGNWSFGDYFKEEQLPWIFSFLVDEIKLDPNRLYVTVFGGDANNGLEKDTEAAEIWKKLFKEKGIDALDAYMGTEEAAAERGVREGERIFYYGAKNWWSRAGVPEKMPIGEPGGPDAEMFYLFPDVEHDPKFGKHCHPNCDCGRYLEIGNSVFMQFVKVADKKFENLPKKNIDFGGGLERIVMAAQDCNDIIRLDVFNETISFLEKASGKSYDDSAYTKSFRVIADHLRASIFLIGDGVIPSNSDQGYFVRRLLRRAARNWNKLGIAEGGLSTLVDSLLSYYQQSYPETVAQAEFIKNEIRKEEEKFKQPLNAAAQYRLDLEMAKKGEMKKIKNFPILSQAGVASGDYVYQNFQSYGVPIDLSKEIIQEAGLRFDQEAFDKKFKEHQELSRAGSEKKFKGGLGDTSEMSLKYHTATHLLNAALRKILGTHVGQRGSNITPERLRFDFNHNEKMNYEQKKQVEELVNGWIKADLPVTFAELPKAEAEKVAVHAFNDKYGDIVKVYSIGTEGNYISREFCGGPHVEHTGILGTFKIQKEEAVSQGVRRIKAVLE